MRQTWLNDLLDYAKKYNHIKLIQTCWKAKEDLHKNKNAGLSDDVIAELEQAIIVSGSPGAIAYIHRMKKVMDDRKSQTDLFKSRFTWKRPRILK